MFLWKSNHGFDKARGITNGRGKYKNLLNCLVGSPWLKAEDSTSLKTVNWIKELARVQVLGENMLEKV